MLYYCPLESIKERYTMQWSAPITGWLERNWIKEGIEYKRIEGHRQTPSQPSLLQKSTILDPINRSIYCFTQIERLLLYIEAGILTSDDIIYFDDFWHPGIEALAYTFAQYKIKPKMFAFCHAQSVDEYDFTHKMKHWMRPFEQGIGRILDGIFVNSDLLKILLLQGGIGTEDTVHVIGHIFCEEEVRERFPAELPKREKTVIYSSRWDEEKNPTFFLDVMDKILRIYQRRDIKFVICTSANSLKSNSKNALQNLYKMLEKYPDNIFLKEGLSKEEYYMELLKAKVQINTAKQDWVSIALLEASTAGCYPLYPDFRSFPQAFRHDETFLYEPFHLHTTVNSLIHILNKDFLWSEPYYQKRVWIHERHNSSWARMINIMFNNKIVEAPNYE